MVKLNECALKCKDLDVFCLNINANLSAVQKML